MKPSVDIVEIYTDQFTWTPIDFYIVSRRIQMQASHLLLADSLDFYIFLTILALQ